MKQYFEGDKGRAVCDEHGLVATTFAYRDVPFDDGSGVVKNILVGLCDSCGKVVSIPPQSTPAIKAARPKAEIPLEAVLPVTYLEALDLAIVRIATVATPSFRKPLLSYYAHRFASGAANVQTLPGVLRETKQLLESARTAAEPRRLSMKLNELTAGDIEGLARATSLSKTDVIKSLVGQIRKDVVEPERPRRLKTLQQLAAVAG